MVDSDTYLQLYQEAWENDGNVGLAPLPGGLSWEEAQGNNTDWVDQTTGLGVKHAYSYSVKYGSEKIKSYANISYDDNESYLLGNSYERLSGRLNLSYDVTKELQFLQTLQLVVVK